MKKPNYLHEIERLKDRYITILDFMSLKYPELKNFSAITRNNLLRQYPHYNKNILQGFREGYHDISEMASMLPFDDFMELNKILVEKFGKGLDEINNKTMRLINRVIKRGKIINDEEYRILEDQINKLSQSKSQQSEIEIINKLLTDYYQKKG